jgi:hypothetical protein
MKIDQTFWTLGAGLDGLALDVKNAKFPAPLGVLGVLLLLPGVV